MFSFPFNDLEMRCQYVDILSMSVRLSVTQWGPHPVLSLHHSELDPLHWPANLVNLTACSNRLLEGVIWVIKLLISAPSQQTAKLLTLWSNAHSYFLSSVLALLASNHKIFLAQPIQVSHFITFYKILALSLKANQKIQMQTVYFMFTFSHAMIHLIRAVLAIVFPLCNLDHANRVGGHTAITSLIQHTGLQAVLSWPNWLD